MANQIIIDFELGAVTEHSLVQQEFQTVMKSPLIKIKMQDLLPPPPACKYTDTVTFKISVTISGLELQSHHSSLGQIS